MERYPKRRRKDAHAKAPAFGGRTWSRQIMRHGGLESRLNQPLFIPESSFYPAVSEPFLAQNGETGLYFVLNSVFW